MGVEEQSVFGSSWDVSQPRRQSEKRCGSGPFHPGSCAEALVRLQGFRLAALRSFSSGAASRRSFYEPRVSVTLELPSAKDAAFQAEPGPYT